MTLVFMSNGSQENLHETRIECNGSYLVFDTSMYAKATQNKIKASEAFRAFNEFLAWEDPEVSNKLFYHYEQIGGIFNDIEIDPKERLRLLKDEVRKLYELVTEERIMHWLRFHSGIQPAPGLTNAYYEGAPEQRTYLVEDYKRLMGLTLALRPMIPVWGHYISLTQNDSGSDYKEYNAIALIADTWIVDSQPYERLLSYLEASIDSSVDLLSPVISGLGTQEMPLYLLALTMVRRLAVGNLYPEKKEDSLISNIYNYIFKNVMGSVDRHFIGKVREKINTEQSDGDNTSIPENYKVKQTIPDGEIELSNIYSERPFDVILKIEPEVSNQMLTACLQSVEAIKDGELLQHYIILTQLIIDSAITAEAVMSLNKAALLNMIAVTQATLWQWGFYDLAALMTATPIINDDPEFFNGSDGRMRISESLKDQLVELFPHFIRSGGNNPPPIEKQKRQNNPGAKAVEEIAAEISYNEWLLNCPAELVALTSNAREGSRRFNTPVDIKNQLAQLIIRIVSNQ